MERNNVVAVIGGSGDLGSGLARCWAEAGKVVLIGSRSIERAQAAANEIGSTVRAMTNLDAATQADIVVLAVPFPSHQQTLEELREALRGKIVVDAVVPLVPPKVGTVQLPDGGSAAQIAQQILHESSRVVSAFHNVGASKLHVGQKADCDVLVFSDDAEAKAMVIDLANDIAVRAIDGGALANSAAAEALTSVLIGINKKYKVKGAGIRITGLSSTDSGTGHV